MSFPGIQDLLDMGDDLLAVAKKYGPTEPK